MATLIELRNVTKSFAAVEGQDPGDGAQQRPVLDGVDLVVAPHETLSIVGPSGSGKSTLLFILGTLEPPTSGECLWEGRDLFASTPEELAAFRSREIGFVFQQHHLLPQLSAFENVLVPTLATRRVEGREALVERARDLLERVGLRDRMAHRPAQLSGGERQRVACVRALINRPRLLLADEPTGSLDRRSAEELTELFLQLNETEGVAVVTVTHAPHLARRMGSCLELVDGRLVPHHETDGTDQAAGSEA